MLITREQDSLKGQLIVCKRIQQTSEKGISSGLKSHVPEEPGSSGWLELQRGREGASSRRAREALNSWLV